MINRMWHAWRHGAVMREVTASRPTRAHGAVFECRCGKRWLSRAPWDRIAGFS